MISTPSVEYKFLKHLYTYLYMGSAIVQLLGCICLYPCFYPLFDGVRSYSYLLIASFMILALLNFMDLIISSCKSTVHCYGISCILAILLLGGTIVYSPIIGHQKDREKIYLVAQAAFFLVQLYTIYKIYPPGPIQIMEITRNRELLTAVLGSFAWGVQFLGTLMFVYGGYIQQLVVLGAFLYANSSLLWLIRIWLHINHPNLKQRSCVVKNEQPEASALSQSSQNAI